MNRIYGYIRISRKEQNPERQQRNILREYPDAKLFEEAFTGTQIEGRKEFEKLIGEVKAGDTIVFDSVSRMSRNAAEGTKVYFDLFNDGVKLVFLKERHIDTEAYKSALKAAGISIETDNTAEGELVSDIAKAITKFMKAKASADIEKAFEQAQKEVDDLHQRTKEGIETVKRRNKRIEEGKEKGEIKRIGGEVGRKLTTKKSIAAKEKILKYSRDFGGMLTDIETMQLIGIANNTFYKYKRELLQELEAANK